MSASYKVLSTITTYNPEIDLLEKNIDAVVGQVDKLLVYENNSINRQDIVDLCARKGVEIILNDKNYGVAGPLHDGTEYAHHNGYDYIFTLDQDSVISDGMVDKLAQILMKGEKIAMVCGTRVNPDFIEPLPPEDWFAPVDAVITSGALADVKAIMDVGNYMPELFIDAVDNEMCYRLKKNGYQIFSSGVTYLHCIGEPIKCKILFKTFRTLNYSPFRLYYTWRNSHLIFRVYKEFRAIKELKKYIRYMEIKIILVEKDKIKKLRAIRRGKKDSKKLYKELKEKYSFL
ncbi:MAG: glycosyltransferase [Clostridia bacterium]|nr:glycosyltransferase [Clostridia bacterium]